MEIKNEESLVKIIHGLQISFKVVYLNIKETVKELRNNF